MVNINRRDHVAEAIRLARQRWVGGPDYEFDLTLADAVLALVRPVEGVTLTPEEVDLAYPALIFAAEHWGSLRGPAWQKVAAQLRAIAARLEASA